MPKVPFIYAKMDVNYADHPKVAGLSDAAFRAHVEMILHARRFLTDGRIANRFANRFGSEVITELVSSDETKPLLVRLSGGDYELHDFVAIQGTRDDAESRSQVNRDNGRLGGRPSGTKSVSESEPKPEGSQSKSKSHLKEVRPTTTPDTFEAFWDTYPRKDAKRKAEQVYRAALKRTSADVILTGAQRYRDDPNRSEQFTAMAPTWLAADRWADGALPAEEPRQAAYAVRGGPARNGRPAWEE